MSPQATAPAAPVIAAPSVPALDPAAAASGGAKVPRESQAQVNKGGAAAVAAADAEKLLLPIAAAAAAVVKPDSFIGKKALTLATGFKVTEAAGQVNKPTPGALLFLLPEPLGALPERFFMSKPHVPGTNVYLDPTYNYTRYRNRREDEERAAARAAQSEALKVVVPMLTSDQLALVLNSSDLRGRYLHFADPREVDRILLDELQRRRREGAQTLALLTDQNQRDREQREQIAIELALDFATRDYAHAAYLADYLRATYPPTRSTPTAARDPLAGVPLIGSIQTELIPVLIDAAQRNARAARGINRELVAERADP
jgi:hypothetical protein